MNTHRLKLYFEEGSISVKLICLGECQPVDTCSECGRRVHEEDTEPCWHCKDIAEVESQCWLAQWVEATDPGEVLEWLQGEVTIEVNGIFEDEIPAIEVYEPERNLAMLTLPC